MENNAYKLFEKTNAELIHKYNITSIRRIKPSTRQNVMMICIYKKARNLLQILWLMATTN